MEVIMLMSLLCFRGVWRILAQGFHAFEVELQRLRTTGRWKNIRAENPKGSQDE